MVTATEWLKKAEAKRSKNSSGFKAVQRRAWDYVSSDQEPKSNPSANEQPNIWEQKEEQDGIENRNNQEQKGEQYENKTGNIREQKEEQNKNEYRNEYGNKKPSQNQSSLENYSLDDHTAKKRVLTLTGHQKQVMRHITSHLKSRVGESCIIDVLPHILATKISAGLEVTRITLKRLAGKNLIIRLPGERGRNGCCKFKVQENIVKICFSLFNDPPCEINHIGNEIGNKNRNDNALSSSNNINITTTMPENWEQIDFSLLSAIGFTKTQLHQLYEKQLNSPEVIQESINHFAFGLENNAKIKTYTEPLNVFMGVLRKGQRWIEPHYISQKELALRQMVEEKRKRKEQRDSTIKELIELDFPDWKRKLTEDQIKAIVPDDIRKSNLTAAINFALRTHFVDKVILPKLEINDGNINDFVKVEDF